MIEAYLTTGERVLLKDEQPSGVSAKRTVLSALTTLNAHGELGNVWLETTDGFRVGRAHIVAWREAEPPGQRERVSKNHFDTLRRT